MRNKFIIKLAGILIFLPLPAFAGVIGHVVAIDGISTVDRSQTTLVTEVGMEIEEADWVRTGNDTKVKIILKDGSIISLGPRVKMAMHKFSTDKKKNESKSVVKLLSGSVRFWIGKLFKTRSFKIKTPTAVAGVRGTHFVIQTSLDDDNTTITTISGEVAVSEPVVSDQEKKKEVLVPAGKELAIASTDTDIASKKPVEYSKERITKLLAETHIPLSLESFQKFNGMWVGGATVNLTAEEYESTGSAPLSSLEAMESEFGVDRPMGKELGPSNDTILDYQISGGSF